MGEKKLPIPSLAGLVGAAVALGGLPRPQRPSQKICRKCEQPILQGDGYRQIAGVGPVHAKCAPLSGS